MKKGMILLSFCAFLLVLTSCQESAKKTETPDKVLPQPGKLTVSIEGEGEFPKTMVGKWQSEKGEWGFDFKEDGTIHLAQIAMGRTTLEPGKITTYETHENGEAIYIPGNWSVVYLPESRELSLEIVMDYIKVEMGTGYIEGNSTDLFTGTASEDGKTWVAEWFSFADYAAYTPEYTPLPSDPEDSPKGQIIFKNIDTK